jgi:hypothetical protein
LLPSLSAHISHLNNKEFVPIMTDTEKSNSDLVIIEQQVCRKSRAIVLMTF